MPRPLVDEETFRAALDAHGLLREGALPPPARHEAFLVFAQRPDARLPLDECRSHAARFFHTRLGLTTEKPQGDGSPPSVDAARVIVAPLDSAGETRTLWGRPRTDDDLAAAAQADTGAGLALLARRCGQVWLVECPGPDDRTALLVAAILAGVVLGPILTPGDPKLLGPKTARGLLGL